MAREWIVFKSVLFITQRIDSENESEVALSPTARARCSTRRESPTLPHLMCSVTCTTTSGNIYIHNRYISHLEQRCIWLNLKIKMGKINSDSHVSKFGRRRKCRPIHRFKLMWSSDDANNAAKLYKFSFKQTYYYYYWHQCIDLLVVLCTRQHCTRLSLICKNRN